MPLEATVPISSLACATAGQDEQAVSKDHPAHPRKLAWDIGIEEICTHYDQ